MGKLMEKILGGATKAPTAAMCGTTKPGCSCRSTGLRIFENGSFAGAEFCECVRGCLKCGGRARFIQGSQSVACKTPDLNRVVNNFNAMTLPARYAHAKMAEFRNYTGNGKAVVQQVHTWLSSVGTSSARSLVVSGTVGVGKTYLLAAAAKDLTLRGYTVRFVDFFQLLSEIRAGYADGQTDTKILKPLIDVDVLFIDELGKGRNSEWEQTIIDSLIMGRYNANKIVACSTNHPLFSEVKQQQTYQFDAEAAGKSTFAPDVYEPLEQRIGKRIYSRLVEMSIFIELSGEDFRRVGRRGIGTSLSPSTPK